MNETNTLLPNMDFERILKNLLASLPPRPISKEALDKLVIDSGATTKFKAQGLPAEWEYLLKKETFELAVRPVLCRASS
jgi:hypothetical protein